MDLSKLHFFGSELAHYTHRVFWDIYPLSKQEFSESSIYRRASYDYIVQTIEKSSDLTTILINYLSSETPANTYAKKFLQGKALKIFPATLGDALINLGRLRNKVVHENSTVNAALTAYDQLGMLVVASFSMGTLAQTFSRCLSNRNIDDSNVVIDANYLLNFANRKSQNQLYAKSIDKVVERIKTDKSIFTCHIDIRSIKEMVSKIT